MKTTVEMTGSLLTVVRRVARHMGTTLRALIEAALRRIVRERSDRGGFELRKMSFRGEGISPDLEDGSWDQIRRQIFGTEASDRVDTNVLVYSHREDSLARGCDRLAQLAQPVPAHHSAASAVFPANRASFDADFRSRPTWRVIPAVVAMPLATATPRFPATEWPRADVSTVLPKP